METREQKIKKLKKEIEKGKQCRDFWLENVSFSNPVVQDITDNIKCLEQQLKELEDGRRNSKN